MSDTDRPTSTRTLWQEVERLKAELAHMTAERDRLQAALGRKVEIHGPDGSATVCRLDALPDLHQMVVDALAALRERVKELEARP